MQVDERERQRDVERLLLGGVGGTLARLERDHEIDPASRTTSLERRDELGAQDVGQQALELAVDSCSASRLGGVNTTASPSAGGLELRPPRKVYMDSRIRPPACSEYWSVHCLPTSSRPLYVETIREDSHAPGRGTLAMMNC